MKRMDGWKAWRAGFAGFWPERARRFASGRRLVLAGVVLTVFLGSVLLTLRGDGLEIFAANRSALVLEVYSQTDLTPEQYTLLEEQLRALEGVRGVVPVSPEEGLKKLAAETDSGIDAQWLMKKSGDLKGSHTLLPWCYSLYLERWEEDFVRDLAAKIAAIEVGTPPRKVVGEIHYDAERWALTFALFRYVRWISAALAAAGLFLLAAGGFVFARCLRKAGDVPAGFSSESRERLGKEAAFVLALGSLCGILGHVLYLLVLRLFFFSGPLPLQSVTVRYGALEILAAVWMVAAAYGAYLCDSE